VETIAVTKTVEVQTETAMLSREKGDKGNREKSNGTKGDKKGKNVTICHVPPGNPDRAHTITVSENAAQERLDRGDYRGACNEDEPKTCEWLNSQFLINRLNG